MTIENSEQSKIVDDAPAMTWMEITLWWTAAIGATIYGIAFVASMNAGYGTNEAVLLGWMTFSGGLIALTLVPVLILTGIRQLIPRLRGVLRSEG